MSTKVVTTRSLCLILFLILVVAESSAATDHPPADASFRFSLENPQKTIISKCVATLVAPQWAITAAHCFDGTVNELVAHCPQGSSAADFKVRVDSMVLHADFDLALLQLPALPGCVGSPPKLSPTVPESAALSSVTLIPGEENSIEFETLQQDELTLVLLDSGACLSRGDSGYPLYVHSQGQFLLAGVLIGGTEECPSYQQGIRLDKQISWIEAVTVKQVTDKQQNEPGCGSAPCLAIESPGAVFCSIDPPGVSGLAALALKSRITFAAGSYEMAGSSTNRAEINSMASIDLETAVSKQRYLADQWISVKTILPLDGNNDSRQRLEVHVVYSTASGEKIDLNFRALMTAGSSVYRLGEKDAAAFLSNGLNLRIRYPAKGAVLYAPCTLPGQVDREFVFKLVDGTQVIAHANAVAGSFELGYSIGRLLRARIEKAGAAVEINDWYNLGYLGSSLSQGDLNAPALVIRTEPMDNACGYVFDPGGWDTAQAVDGYLAYTLRCDNSLGEPLPLLSASYPVEYVFP